MKTMTKKQLRKNRAKFIWRRFKVTFNKDKYIEGDDIRRVGKTTHLVKKAYNDKMPVVIVVPYLKFGEIVEETAKKLGLTKSDLVIVTPNDLNYMARVNVSHINKCHFYLEEGLHREDLRILTQNVPNFQKCIKLSYSKYTGF